MNSVFLRAGLHGDIRPYVALGLQFKNSGFDVRIATFEAQKAFIQKSDIDCYPLKGSPFFENEAATDETIVNTGNTPLKFIKQLHSELSQASEVCLVDCWHAMA